MVLFLKVVHLLQPLNVSDSGTNKRKITAKDLILCHRQALTVLLPYDFFLLGVFDSNNRGHHKNLGILFLEL